MDWLDKVASAGPAFGWLLLIIGLGLFVVQVAMLATVDNKPTSPAEANRDISQYRRRYRVTGTFQHSKSRALMVYHGTIHTNLPVGDVHILLGNNPRFRRAIPPVSAGVIVWDGGKKTPGQTETGCWVETTMVVDVSQIPRLPLGRPPEPLPRRDIIRGRAPGPH